MASKKKPKRKLSKYNLHMQREMKAGKTFDQAVALWKPTGSSNKTSKKPQKKVNKTAKKTKKSRNSGIMLPGGLGPKGIAMGALGLLFVPRITGIRSPGGSKLATGLALRTLKIGGGGPLAAVGIMELALQYLGGSVMPLLGGNGNAGGATDF